MLRRGLPEAVRRKGGTIHFSVSGQDAGCSPSLPRTDDVCHDPTNQRRAYGGTGSPVPPRAS